MKYITVILTILFAVGTVPYTIDSAHAQEQQQCTKEDNSKIKSFNNKAKRKQNEYKRAMKKFRKVKTHAEANRINKEMKEIKFFFHCAKYEQMRPVYERCGVDMPRLND